MAADKDPRTPLCKYVKNYMKIHEQTENLKGKLADLKSCIQRIKEKVNAESRQVISPRLKPDVVEWLKNTEKIIEQAQDIEQKVKDAKMFSLKHFQREIQDVDKMIEEMEKLRRSGLELEDQKLVNEAPLARGVERTTTTLIGETMKKNMGEIWEYLTGNEVVKIGVCGMGGIGKTNIMEHINNKLRKDAHDKFEYVVWITVSQAFELVKLQEQIAAGLQVTLKEKNDTKILAETLKKESAKKKFVLILDDMWEEIKLEEVGIPEPTRENGCKLVITTRSIDVCDSMKCKVLKLKLLTEAEAWELFSEKVGNINSDDPELEEIAKSVLRQCAGLPFAIVTAAGSMKERHDIEVWRYALEELSQKKVDICKQLRLSYDRLKEEKLRHCFLYCALYPEDFKISKNEITGSWIAVGLVDKRKSVQESYAEGLSILKIFVNNFLLESDGDGRWVKMHSLLRDMAVHITSESPRFMIKSGLQLRKSPEEEEWKETNPERASLMWNEISEIPSNMSPNCPTLSTLLLQRNPVENIPESFFVNMKELKLLDLSYTKVEALPSSISDLTNLRTLLLQFCEKLQHVPSLEKLSSLLTLDLRCTSIKKVPDGIEKLVNLTYLNLYSLKIDELPTGKELSQLKGLQELRIYWGKKTLAETVEEAARLNNLETFGGHFHKLDDFNLYVKSLEPERQAPKSYNLLLAPASEFDMSFPVKDVYMKDVTLWDCNISEGEGSVVIPRDVKRLKMNHCDVIRSLNDFMSRGRGLTVLCIHGCRNLQQLSSFKVLSGLTNLEVIDIKSCFEMKEIIAPDVKKQDEEGTSSSEKQIFLPKLRKLQLWFLPELESISKEEINCGVLREIDIRKCPKLRKLPLFVDPPPATTEIKIGKGLWESLEWENANAKYDLHRHCQFMPYY
ncbi:hypothetical protein Pint_30333 [Pistacia integerrima]|uniref:Uncharacterized protein n=1 Tax=Pistacia integerrima TaxID=434235 RepID=A0ACC0X2D0_9ROSI|nr:hypothetical protein Pint_30333 [Pistacia integerrima]